MAVFLSTETSLYFAHTGLGGAARHGSIEDYALFELKILAWLSQTGLHDSDSLGYAIELPGLKRGLLAGFRPDSSPAEILPGSPTSGPAALSWLPSGRHFLF